MTMPMTSFPRAPRRRATFGNSGSMQGAAEDQYNTEAGYASDATGAYLDAAKAYDPTAAVNKYAQGAWGSISDALGQTLKQQAGAAVGAGRIDTGFFDEDNGTVINRATKQLSDSIAQQSMGAAGLQLQNQNQLGQFGENMTQDANDQLASEREYQYNLEQQKKKQKSGMWGTIGGVLGMGAGAFLGGPAGASVGGSIGSALGGLL